MSVSAFQSSFRYAASAEPALVDFGLRIEPGEFVVLSGPSGCGKTTATRLLNGLIPHFHAGDLAGRVQVFGDDPTRQEIWRTAADVGSVFQNPRSQFFTTDPVSEIAFGCENLGFPSATTEERVEEALRDFDFTNLRDRSIFALSGGEKQRLACASVAALRPRLYVLDEPSANLDAVATERLSRIMARWKASGAAVVVAEHRLAYMRDLVDRLVILSDGRVAGEYTGEQFRAMTDDHLAALGLRPVVPPPPPAAGLPADSASAADDSSECPPARGAGAPTLDVVDFTFRYSPRTVPGVGRRRTTPTLRLDRLRLPKGRITALTGANGSGKTTLARWMAGLSRSRGGRLLDAGRPLSRRQRRRRVFLVLQDVNHQLVTESVGDEIEVTLRLAGVGDLAAERARILRVVDLCDQDDRHPMSLSGGQKQRLAIGTALASRRDIVILDEPTSGLDLAHMQGVADALRRLTDEGRTVLVATHDTELIAACADHVIALGQHMSLFTGFDPARRPR